MKKKQSCPIYGGQAIVEGVMFGNSQETVSAIRRIDGSIHYFYAPKMELEKTKGLKKIPFVRGIISLIDSALLGSKHLTYSTDRYEVDPEEPIHKEEPSKLTVMLGVVAVTILSLFFGKFLFTVVPVFLAEIFHTWAPSRPAQVLIETGFKLLLLLGYIALIAQTPTIKRVFQYHGAEHKVINAFESGKKLTVENVRQASRLHYRCGSSFILLTVIVGMIIYFFVPADPLWLRLTNRVLLIPVVIGIAFEVLQLTNAVRDIPILKYLGYPGLSLQLLTTKEPTDEQIEVAIHSFNKLREVERMGLQAFDYTFVTFDETVHHKKQTSLHSS